MEKNFDLFNESTVLASNLNVANEDVGFYQQDPMNNIILAEAIINATLNTDELAALCENTTEKNILFGDSILSEKSIIKFDKAAKLKRAESQALIMIAREKKDRDLNRLIRIWKMRRLILDKWAKRYGMEAQRRAKEMVRMLGRSKSIVAQTAAKRAK